MTGKGRGKGMKKHLDRKEIDDYAGAAHFIELFVKLLTSNGTGKADAYRAITSGRTTEYYRPLLQKVNIHASCCPSCMKKIQDRIAKLSSSLMGLLPAKALVRALVPGAFKETYKAGRSPEITSSDICRLHNAIERNSIAEVIDLITRGVNVNTSDRRGWKALHVAVRFNRRTIAALLISFGADVNCRTKIKETPLHWAAEKNLVEMAKLLLSAGADVNAMDSYGNTPLSWADSINYRSTHATMRPEISHLLRSHGARDWRDDSGNNWRKNDGF
jgi:hypothetical protein